MRETITNLNGFVGWAAVGGMGTRTAVGEAPQHLHFEADVRFMIGEFVGADGRNHHGATAMCTDQATAWIVGL